MASKAKIRARAPLKCGKCDWVGNSKQLAIWLSRDTIVSRICPSCGNRVAHQRTLLSLPSYGQTVH